MIGPGWMPSRPRPLARVRRVFTYYPPYYARRRRRRARAEQWPLAPAAFDCGGDGRPAGLPTATLHAGAHQSRHRLVLGEFQRWLVDRWAWLRPRSIPLLVACAALPGMLAFVDVVKHPANQGGDLRLHVRIDVSGTAGHVASSDGPAQLLYPAPSSYAAATVLVGPPTRTLCISSIRPAAPASLDGFPRSFETCLPLQNVSTR